MEAAQLIELIKLGNGASKVLSEAYLFESRLRGHTEIIPAYNGSNMAIKAIAARAAAFLPPEKQAKILAATIPPLPSNEIIDTIFTVYESIFNGKNPSRTVSGSTDSFTQSLKAFLDKSKAESIFNTKAFGVFKNAPNALMVVDAPAKGGDAYISFKDVTTLYAFKEKDGVFEYAVFETEKGKRYAAYTDTHFVSIQNDNGIYTFVENPHNAKACPVRFFWTDYAQYTNQNVKATPLTSLLQDLDKYNYYVIAEDYSCITGLHPITVIPEMECNFNYSTGEFDNNEQPSIVSCQGGILVNGAGLSISGAKHTPCPACSPNRLAGPGSVLSVPAPVSGTTATATPVQFPAPPLDATKFFDTYIEAYRSEIVVSATGKDSSVSDKLAINSDQVNDTKESRESVVSKIARNFSSAKSWAIQMLLRVQHQSDIPTYDYNFGTEFYTLSESQLVEKIKSAKDAGLSYGVVNALDAELAIVRNQHNPAALDRQRIIEAIEPFPSLTFDQTVKISPEIAFTKYLFPTWLSNTEAEIGGSIGNFNTKSDLLKRIEYFRKSFYTFVNNYKTQQKTDTNEQTEQRPDGGDPTSGDDPAGEVLE